jgi:ABC-type nitrate/sulfonate/bicarbonate transport system permease component
LPHDDGAIMVGNERVTEPIAGVAMVFQHFGLFPWKTVLEKAAYGLWPAHGGCAEGRHRAQGARIHQAGRANLLSMMIELVLPSSMPYLLAGLRLAAGRALIGAVVAEFFVSIGGLGYFILYNSRSYHHNEAFVGVVPLASFGVGFELLVNWNIWHFMPWYRSDEATD